MSIVAIGIASDTLAIAQLVGEIFVATISTVLVKHPCYTYGRGKAVQTKHYITPAIKYLNQCHSGGACAGLDPVARIQGNSLDAGSVIPDLIRDRHDECFLFHSPFNKTYEKTLR